MLNLDAGRGASRCPTMGNIARKLRTLGQDHRGQDIAEYAVMLAVILIIVIGTVKLIGTSANNTFSNVGSSLQ
jgi:Flp pilus assembly pilin Flp